MHDLCVWGIDHDGRETTRESGIQNDANEMCVQNDIR